MSPSLGLDVAAPRELAWKQLTDLTRWPQWGPTVRGARLDDGSDVLYAGATGSVQTSVGLWLPFRVEHWRDDESVSSWSWRVAGVPATGHTVTSEGPSRCRVEMTVPWFAPAYLGVVWVGLVKIRRLAETAAGGDVWDS